MHSSTKLVITQMNLNLSQLPWIPLSALFLGWALCSFSVRNRYPCPRMRSPFFLSILAFEEIVMAAVTGLIVYPVPMTMKIAGFNDVQFFFTIVSLPPLGSLLGAKIAMASRPR